MDKESQNETGSASFASSAMPVGTLLLTLLYLGHTILYWVGLQHPDGTPHPGWLAYVTGVSCLIFAVLTIAVRNRERDQSSDQHLIGFCGLVVLANITVHFAVSGQIWYGYNFIFYMLAVGAIVSSRWWFVVLTVVTPIIALGVALQTIDEVPLDLFAAIVVIGSGISSLLHVTRVAAINKLKAVNIQAEASKHEAEQALALTKSSEKRLERVQDDLQGILDKSPEVILIHREGHIVYVNPALLDCLRLTESEAHDVPVETLLADKKALPTGPVRATFKRSDGEKVILQLSAPVEVQYDASSATLLTGRDVTAQDADMQAKLLLADRMAAIGVLSAGVAHEINNPLSYVLGNLETLNYTLDQLGDKLPSADIADMRELIGDCLHGSHRVADIVKTLQVMARPQDALDVADLSAAIHSASKMAAIHLRHRSVELVVDLPDNLPDVHGSPAKLSQVFLNLLINATQACDRAKATNEVRISATHTDTTVVVVVSDTGCGMSKEAQRRLFDPFFTTKPLGEGTGLGLYFCHNEITRCGGTIEFESEEDVGTRFEITLRHAELTATEKSAAPRPQFKIGSALIIDDEKLVARALKRMLHSDEVQIATSGAMALELLATDDFEFVFCDLMMPEMSGPEFYAEALKIRPDLAERVIFVTGGAFTDSAAAFVSKHQDRMLYKPLSRQALTEILDQLRGQAGDRRQGRDRL